MDILQLIKEGNAREVSRNTGIPYDRIAKWRQGKGSPKADDMKILEEYYGITSNRIIKTKSGLEYKESGYGDYTVEVPLVPFEAHAMYVAEDVQEYGEWDKVTFPVDKVGRGNYLGFKAKGDSMFPSKNPGFNDTPDGALLLCRELGRQHWVDGFYKNGAPYGWVIVTNKNILLKDIIAHDEKTHEITCHSRNDSPEYSDFKISLNDVHQIFKVIKRTF